jgi:predicted RNase H-like nuclease (RuvC/YqgF family)
LEEKQTLEHTANDQAEQITNLEYRLREAERKEAIAVREKTSAVKELEQLKKFIATDYKTVEQLKAQLQEEHTTNASLIIFNR